VTAHAKANLRAYRLFAGPAGRRDDDRPALRRLSSESAQALPEEVQKADLAVIRDQVSLFDRLLVHDELPKILDLGGRDFTRFFTIASETGFFEEARRLSIEPVLFYCIDETTATLETARRINREWPELMLVFVANEGAALLGEDPLATLAQYPSERNFQIPALDNVLWRPIDRPGFSLSRFLLAPPADMSIVVRRALQVWIAQIFAQFQSFELRIAMESTDFLK
jgi:hypothetical protein